MLALRIWLSYALDVFLRRVAAIQDTIPDAEDVPDRPPTWIR